MTSETFSSREYWEARYRAGGTSGAGSFGRLATFKASFINAFVSNNSVHSVLDLGCGDGNLLSLLQVPDYTGVDISPSALARCAERFAHAPSYAFLAPDHLQDGICAELSLSIDVIFHLVEPAAFQRHLHDLFSHTSRFAIIYASNHDSVWPDRHVRHRRFSDAIEANWPEWNLLAHVPNRFPYDRIRPNDTSFADFFVYARGTEPCVINIPAGSPHRMHPAPPAEHP